MATQIPNRDAIVRSLQRELVGPAPQGKELDCSSHVTFPNASDSYGPWRQLDSGEEIITRDSPTKRYGIGVLYPFGSDQDDEKTVAQLDPVYVGDGANAERISDPLTDSARQSLEKIVERSASAPTESDTDDFDLSSANAYKPSSMAISFLAQFPEGSELVVEATGGRYHRKTVQVEGKDRTWWLRSPVSLKAVYTGEEICASPQLAKVPPTKIPLSSNNEGLDLRIEVYSRPWNTNTPGWSRLLTVCLVNRTPAASHSDALCLFQSHLHVSVGAPGGAANILPYPGSVSEEPDDEEQSLALLYRSMKTFAVGHGCAADWGMGPWSPDQTSGRAQKPHDLRPGLVEQESAAVDWVAAEALPVVETPSITPDIRRPDGTPVEVPMATLAGLVPRNDGMQALADVVTLYEEWIAQQRSRILQLAMNYRGAAERHMKECARCAERMRDGLTYLAQTPTAQRAFQLANHAMLLQQIRSGREPRRARYDDKAQRIVFSEPYLDPDVLEAKGGRGKWRAFQIAFLLMAVKSTGDGTAADRRTVELIWFPTGGGKTEAYLGLAAYAMFKSRLENAGSADFGVQVLMRYTLRLLTAQQFQRASGLICAMEHLRRSSPKELGPQPFSIGIWLGGSTTPNTRDEAKSVLRGLEEAKRYAENKFILSRCPWCRAQLGPIKLSCKAAKSALRVIGYERRGNSVVFECPEAKCEYSRGLPIYVVDEDIYEQRPSLVIGTVDKFALLAWRPTAQALFGFANGQRVTAPPNLIIQDELHLISGPLGSMVGLFESVIEELCTDRRGQVPVPPKIVSSTATIRRYEAQIRALYARTDVALFPPPGLDASDSFFARYARNPDGTLQPGRLYVGVHAPGLGSLQTAQVRTFSALLQAPLALPPEERDPWWTLLLFFNSLRELGTTLSLFQSDIPDYLLVMRNRTGIDFSQMRRLWNILELTGRLRTEEVPEAISALEVPYPASSEQPVDVCLASNIIEVGIDIDRLSLMSIVGQPKTTAQYIQVAGRVGRQWWERPGLVVTIYGASKPRDRSHFEKFRTYHERLYAQVEPTSVTPLSPPVLDRALHATMVAYVRQQGKTAEATSPYPYPAELIDTWHKLLLPRIRMVDPTEEENFEQVFSKRMAEWQQWKRRLWEQKPKDDEIPLLRMAGDYASRERARLSWPTPTSMRDVDAECRAIITRLYALGGPESDGRN